MFMKCFILVIPKHFTNCSIGNMFFCIMNAQNMFLNNSKSMVWKAFGKLNTY